MIKTMGWQHSYLLILDQTKLPQKIEYIKCYDYQRIGAAIKRLEVRGAPAIGAAAAFAMVLGFHDLVKRNLPLKSFWNEYKAIKNELIATRPTAVKLQWAVDNIWHEAYSQDADNDYSTIGTAIEALAIQIYENDIAKNIQIGIYGSELLKDDTIILTHCNAGALATCGWGTALGVIRQAHKDGKIKMVYVDETRPLMQGSRLTAWELLQDDIPATLISDNMAGWTMKQKKINAVVVGADRIALNGDTANKIGTYSVAILAKEHGIPFYIAAPSTTFDFTINSGSAIPIEERDGEELREISGVPTAPKNMQVFNPAFDVTPNELIAGIITEYGVIMKPYEENIRKLQKKISEEE